MNEKINLQDLAGLLAEKSGVSKKDSEVFLREFFDLLAEVLVAEKQVKVRNLGSFKLTEVEARESVDVRTGERMLIPAHHKINFVPDKYLSETVNEPFALFEPVEIITSEIGPDADMRQAEEEEPESPVGVEPLTDSLSDEKKRETESKFVPFVPVDWQEEKLGYRAKSKKIMREINWRGIGITLVILLAITFSVYLFLDDDPFHEENYIHSGWENMELDLQKKHQTPPVSATLPKDTLTSPDTVSVPVTKPAAHPDTVRKVAVEKVIPPDEVKKVAVKNTGPSDTEKKQEVTKTEPNTVRTRTIEPGERLTVIALQEYGNKIFWVYLYEENKAIIKDPNNVTVGLKIVIPPAGKYNIDKDNPESIRKAEELGKRIARK